MNNANPEPQTPRGLRAEPVEINLLRRLLEQWDRFEETGLAPADALYEEARTVLAKRDAEEAPSANPRFVWAIGAIHELFPDVPENLSAGNDLVLWDRQEKCAVATVHNPYAQAMCLETTAPGDAPLSALEAWFNGCDNAALESEGMPPSREEFAREGGAR